ncbi:PREDICTED: protein SLOW GREEN 1, chloroplastic-like [Ipomoea nil]|uniref:protein SLOW GREEN 1, chloroplastic-like n=1 Tax=Ipomoea nil TaxID=35883 RepID=UPI0009009A5F|nr:PREDICTED: protein SLOW GREEN 1, chloroplastic-like [Ipomoea nil]
MPPPELVRGKTDDVFSDFALLYTVHSNCTSVISMENSRRNILNHIVSLIFSLAQNLRSSIGSKSSGAPVSAPAAVETAFSDEDKERVLEENLLLNPNDVGALRSLMEMKIQSRKIAKAIGIIDRLMEIDPSDTEWPLLKSHLYAYSGEVETAKNGFNEILAKDPFRAEAYHGLVMAASKSKSTQDLMEIEKRIEEGMKLCKKQGKKAEFRDFKLLEAQIRVIEGKHDEALKVYQELVKEEPRDFRPYICQGIIYTLLRKNNEAEKNFEKFRRLVPKGHPYATYFDETMIATKVFAQKMENEIAMSKK